MHNKNRFPFYGWIGLILVFLFWFLNWFLPGQRTIWGFFPLWLGYAITVDALVMRRKGNSLMTRNVRVWAGLFFVSAPVWWLFELLNMRTQNWFYPGTESLSTVQYAFFSTLSFSTVMPAVFGTAELVGSWKPLQKFVAGPVISRSPAFLKILLTVGLLMLALMFYRPDIYFPFLWVSPWLIVEALNVKSGNRTILADLWRGDWRNFLALSIGTLICGFFWEMWNFYSFPKWIYRIPYADVFHVFEMPLAGYLGYIPFSLELFSLYHLLTMPWRKDRQFSEILPIK